MPGRIQVAAEIRTWKVSLHAGDRRKTGPSRVLILVDGKGERQRSKKALPMECLDCKTMRTKLDKEIRGGEAVVVVVVVVEGSGERKGQGQVSEPYVRGFNLVSLE